MQGLLTHWSRSEVPLRIARRKWLENSIQFLVSVANFKEKKDRQALLQYGLTGDVLDADVGSVVMWSLPKDYLGKIAMDESIFQTIHFESLMQERIKNGNIMDSAVKYLREGVAKLKNYVTSKQVLFDFNFKLVNLENEAVIKEISSLNPYTISWSNCCDYFEPKDFHKLAKSCSGKSTVHFAYTMNWPQRVYGSSYLDYKANTKEGNKFLDKLVDASCLAVDTLYKMLGCKDVLLSPPVADPRNLADAGLYVTHKQKWIDYFFSKDVSGVEDKSRQVQADKTFFNFFDRSHSTIHYTFNYDPTSSFKGFWGVELRINYIIFYLESILKIKN